MCIAILSRVVELRDHTAVVECYGAQRKTMELFDDILAAKPRVGD